MDRERRSTGFVLARTETGRKAPPVYQVMTRSGSSESEAALVERLRSRDPRAMEEFVARYQAFVSRQVARVVDVAEDREEVCQDVFLRAYRKLHTFDGRSSLATWLGRVAYRTSLNRVARRRRLEVSLNDGLAGAARTTDPHLRAEERDRARRVRAEVAALPPRYRDPIALYYLEDLPVADVGSILDLPAGTVKTRLHRGRELLRERLEARGLLP